MKRRLETDALGSIQVPVASLFGIQTTRAIENFGSVPVGFALSQRPALVRALIYIKRAAASSNRRLGLLDARRSKLIVQSCNQLLQQPDWASTFPVHLLHGGGGTSANMNLNEVIANMANSSTGEPLGTYRPVHPLDHVNKSQSTNDVYPSACRLAVALETERLLEAIAFCVIQYQYLVRRFGSIPRTTRTCLQDAVASTWHRYFGAQIQVLKRHRGRLAKARDELCQLNLGGGVAGEPHSSPPQFSKYIIEQIAKDMPTLPIRGTKHFADAAQNSDDFMAYGHALDGLCRTLIKQASDLRLLSSGPECGLMEIALSPRQPGSTAMPGKVNPVVPEFVMQCCFTVLGSVSSCGLAAEHGELDLNVWEGVFVHALCSGIDLLDPALTSYAKFCLADLSVNKLLSTKYADNRTSRAAAYAKRFSYSAAIEHYDSPDIFIETVVHTDES